MLPNFLVIGAPKCATTALCQHLDMHPEIFISKPKETFFFSYDDMYAKGIKWYENIFSSVTTEKAIGDGTTVYSQTQTFPNTLDRIIKHVPDAKIIYVVRHPIQRIQSHWVEMYSQGLTMEDFNSAVINDPQYIDASLYFYQLNQYLKHFSEENILILFYEDIKDNFSRELSKVFSFLGVDETFEVPNAEKPIYSSEGKRHDLAITNLIRSTIPGFKNIRNATPQPIRNLAKRFLKKEIKGKPEWNSGVRAKISDSLRDDTAQFLKFTNKSPDYWVF